MTRRNFLKALATNATDSAFPARIPTATLPSTAIANQGDSLTFLPYGVASNDHTFDLRVYGWSAVRAADKTELWIPTMICQLACTHTSTQLGITNGALIATELFCDAITLTNGSAILPSAPANQIASATVDVEGFDYFEFTFDIGSGTNANALILPSGEYSV
jgi:hypothetical protein